MRVFVCACLCARTHTRAPRRRFAGVQPEAGASPSHIVAVGCHRNRARLDAEAEAIQLWKDTVDGDADVFMQGAVVFSTAPFLPPRMSLGRPAHTNVTLHPPPPLLWCVWCDCCVRRRRRGIQAGTVSACVWWASPGLPHRFPVSARTAVALYNRWPLVRGAVEHDHVHARARVCVCVCVRVCACVCACVFPRPAPWVVSPARLSSPQYHVPEAGPNVPGFYSANERAELVHSILEHVRLDSAAAHKLGIRAAHGTYLLAELRRECALLERLPPPPTRGAPSPHALARPRTGHVCVLGMCMCPSVSPGVGALEEVFPLHHKQTALSVLSKTMQRCGRVAYPVVPPSHTHTGTPCPCQCSWRRHTHTHTVHKAARSARCPVSPRSVALECWGGRRLSFVCCGVRPAVCRACSWRLKLPLDEIRN